MATIGSTVRCLVITCCAAAGGAHAAPAPLARPLAMPERAGFEANRGQWPAPVRFVVRDGPATVFLTDREAVWRTRAARGAQAVRLRWPRAGAPVAGPAAAARVHYLRGGAAGGATQDVPLHRDLTYPAVFPGVDLVFHDRRGALEYDLLVAPGADPAAIRLTLSGAARAALDGDGNLVLDTAGGAIVQRAPIAWQEHGDGREPVAVRYALQRRDATVELGFALGAWDRTRPLVIDPSVVYATDIDTGTDTVSGVAVDGDGNLWLAGTTPNVSFPTSDDAAQAEKNGAEDGYVARLDADGVLRYATYIGGSTLTCLGDIDIAADGSLLLAGITIDSDFPIAGDAAQPTAAGGGGDAFVARLDAAGRLLHSSYFGGSGAEQCGGRLSRPARIAAIAGGGAYLLIGLTTSTELPAAGATRARLDGDVALVRFDERLQPLWGRFLGGTANDVGYEVDDTADGAVVYGHTSRIFGMQRDFPTTAGALQEDNDLDTAHFIARYDGGGALVAATLFGPPSGAEPLIQPGDVAVDADGAAVIAVTTGAANMPATAGALQPTLRGFSDFFVARLTPELDALTWGTYLGGSQAEKIGGIGLAVVAHADDRVSVGGVTESADYPLQAPLAQAPSDQVLTTLAADGASLVFSTRVALGTAALAVGDGGLYVGGQRINRLGVGGVRIDDRVAPACRGDCDGDGAVQVNELVLGVRIALGQDALAVCAAFDADGNGTVVIAELVGAVGAALAGCG